MLPPIPRTDDLPSDLHGVVDVLQRCRSYLPMPLQVGHSARVLLAIVIVVSSGQLSANEPVNYVREIKPILRERCYACHGVLKSESSLRLDTAAFALQGGDSGAAIVPDMPQKSLLLQRIAAVDVGERMPPEGEPLSADQIVLIRRWIEQGAPAPADEQPEEDPREHWSFRPPVRAELPRVRHASWSTNPIDRFIASEHESRGLTPRPPADRALLLRRVHLDLIGLPPTREQLQQFLSDSSPDAYDRVVTKLLDSPQYGERWARHWMDVWRYSDWFGRRMVPDVWNSAPQIWRWRDWIVQSLNNDKGYERMIQEMLAADEVAPEDPDAAVATGFLIRNWYALNPNDWMRSNVEHTAKAFLGLTYNCAHCHDHKYDPITQDDYFALRAFFEPIGIRQDRVPGEADPGPFQEYEYSVLRKIVRLGSVSVYDKAPEAPTWFYEAGDERQRDTERGTIPPGLPAIFCDEDPQVRPIELPAVAYYPASRPELRDSILADLHQAVTACEQELAAARTKMVEELPGLQEQLALTEPAPEEQDSSTDESSPSRESPSQAAAQRAIDLLNHWVRAAELKLVAAQAELASAEARIAADRARYDGHGEGSSDALTSAAVAVERSALIKAADAAVAEHERLLAEAEARPTDDAKRQEAIDAATKKLEEVRSKLEETQAAEMPSDYTPLGPIYPSQSTGRRKVLAEWIGGRENPLTARVAINHIWMRHFHAPLVTTVFDFGRNGAAPTHPELLDWLAVELMESGWSMKHIHRLIVTSHTYQMASSQGEAVRNAELDPENRYLWRMNTGRMEAEVVRDSLLYCTGGLDLTVGGQELENKDALTTFRRSLYYSCQPEVDGKSSLGMLFDAPDANECYRRTRSVVPQQALALANSDLVHSLSRSLTDRLLDAIGSTASSGAAASVNDEDNFIHAAFETILSRPPTRQEIATCNEFLTEQRLLLAGQASEDSHRRAAESLVRVLLNHNDFVAIR